MNIPSYLTDTQCGFKIYKGDIGRELYAECVCDGCMFDVEIILRALKKRQIIAEFPIEWRNDRDTRVRAMQTSGKVFSELMTIKKVLASE